MRACAYSAATSSLTKATIFRSSSASSQSEQTPQQTNTAWRSGVLSQPIREGGEAGPPHRRQSGGETVALNDDGIAPSGNKNEIGS